MHAERDALVYNGEIGIQAPSWRRVDPPRHHDEVPGMRHRRSSTRSLIGIIAFFAVVPICILVGLRALRNSDSPASLIDRDLSPQIKTVSYSQGAALSLRGGVDWINSSPISLTELRGKIVLLDFWTFCCINCHHILPELAKLEEKYKNELVVIGVHSPKFEAERDTENIRRKVHEYRIKHPVINDANMTIWNRFAVRSWPTLILIDAKGNYVDRSSGEGNFAAVDRVIGELVEHHKARGELNLTPLQFTPEMERSLSSPLLFPGKIVADAAGKRLFIADTGHNRIVQVSLAGTDPVVIGSGEEGFEDGELKKASFNRPQGMYLAGDTLYVADTENHAIRKVDLKEGNVATIAGIGSQASEIHPVGSSWPAKTVPLSSPWDVIQLAGDKALYVAMAGPHQIWKLDFGAEMIGVFAGSGREDIVDGPAESARFAQPSGLATDGENLFVADSEVSGVRVILGIHQTKEPSVRTIVGEGLFEFGDHDGRAGNVRLQHCLGLAYADGHLYIADTYNNKIKVCEPRARTVKSLVGNRKAGDADEPSHFYEPGGLSAAEGRLYVADTNNHKIKVVDLNTHAVKTLELKGLTPPKLAAKPPVFPNAKMFELPAVSVPAGKSIAVAVSVELPKGFKLNEETPVTWLVEAPGKTGVLGTELRTEGQHKKPPTTHFDITVPLAASADAGEKLDLRFFLKTFVCSEKSSLCMIQSYIWDVPVSFTATGGVEKVTLSNAVAP
jgi:thiol-disulfide isomerase/thioredoxin